jgi:DNA-binding MarR family transcriptional regulator
VPPGVADRLGYADHQVRQDRVGEPAVADAGHRLPGLEGGRVGQHQGGYQALDFENLLAFRVALRRFQRWSEDQAVAAGLTQVQHQLLVAIKGHPGTKPPSVGQIADYLLLQSHSAVGLVDRAEAAGFVRRCPDPGDARVARVELTEAGDQLVTGLTEVNLAEMHKLAAALSALIPADQPAG